MIVVEECRTLTLLDYLYKNLVLVIFVFCSVLVIIFVHLFFTGAKPSSADGEL